jgi:hypothetical protein
MQSESALAESATGETKSFVVIPPSKSDEFLAAHLAVHRSDDSTDRQKPTLLSSPHAKTATQATICDVLTSLVIGHI